MTDKNAYHSINELMKMNEINKKIKLYKVKLS